jgi:GxxExxY protein
LAHALRLDGHKALREVHLDITYEGLCVPNSYIMDIVVDDKVVVEAKAIEKFSDVNFAQLNSYLHFSSFEVGLLLNFHNWPLKDGGIKRLINTKA